MAHAHLLLAQSQLADGNLQGARLSVENTLPYVSHVPEDRAALLSVVVKSWIGEK
jgi:hypothetical protein